MIEVSYKITCDICRSVVREELGIKCASGSPLALAPRVSSFNISAVYYDLCELCSGRVSTLLRTIMDESVS